MGVRGLSGLIDSNPYLLRSYQLRNEYVIIDGYNLAFTLYLEGTLDCVMGGEYAEYAQIVRSYFNQLRECHITPIVVIDGAYEASQAKLKTIMHRYMDKIKEMKFISQGNAANIKVMPVLGTEVFKQVLREMKIKIVQCNFEADEQIAQLAIEYQCPVLSNDSDFIVYDIPSGLIRFHDMDNYVSEMSDHREPYKTYKCIRCRIFYIDDFLKRFDGEIKKELLPLFGIIVGNDFVDDNAFSHFLNALKLPKARSKSVRYHTKHRYIIGMLNFLSTQKDLDSCIQYILSFLPREVRSARQKLLLDCLGRYNMENCGNSGLCYQNGKQFPAWFVERFRQCKIASKLITCMVGGILYLSLQVESTRFRSSFEATLKLRKNLYGVVFNGVANCVKELDRSGCGMRYTDVDFPWQNVSLEQIPSLSPEARMKHFLDCCMYRTDVLNLVDSPDGKLLLLALEYLVFEAKLNRLLCVSIITMNIVVQAFADHETKDCGSNNYLLKIPVRVQDVHMFKRFFRRPDFHPRRKLDIELTHKINEYIATIANMGLLNGVFMCFEHNIHYHQVMNGVFLYNLYKVANSKANPENFICDKFPGGSLVRQKFATLIEFVDRRWYNIESRYEW